MIKNINIWVQYYSTKGIPNFIARFDLYVQYDEEIWLVLGGPLKIFQGPFIVNVGC